MTITTTGTLGPAGLASLVDRYLAVWSEPDPVARREAVTSLWTRDGVEFVEGARFAGHDALVARVAEAYGEFVGSGKYAVTAAGDVSAHGDLAAFTIQLVPAGPDAVAEPAWAARVFLLLDAADGRIREDYQLTVRPFAA